MEDFEDPHHRSMAVPTLRRAGAPRCGERNRPRKKEAAAHGGVRRRGQRVRWDHGTLGLGMNGKVVEVYRNFYIYIDMDILYFYVRGYRYRYIYIYTY